MSKRLMSGRTTTSPKLYKELYRTYYHENWKVVRIILTVLSIPCFIMALYFYTMKGNVLLTIVLLWVGMFSLIYPRNAFRSAYRRVKDDMVSIHFTFYEDSMKEKMNGKAKEFAYKKMHTVIDAPGYFYFFHTKTDVSVLEKKEIIDGTSEELAELLKSKVKKYKIKKQ